MANLTSFRSYKSTRTRSDVTDGRAETGITHTANGLPCLDIEIKPSGFGTITGERIHRLILSPEETEAVVRVIYRGGAHGMNQLRAKYEPVEG